MPWEHDNDAAIERPTMRIPCFALFLSALLWLLFGWAVFAYAQVGAPTQCGPTSIGGTASAVTFPATGGGPPNAQRYLSIANPNSSGFLCVSATGTATVSGSGCAAGSLYIGALAPPLAWYQPEFAPPASLSIVGSTAGLAVTCLYQ